MNTTKQLTVLALTGLLSGCFLTVDVDEGGMVESSLGDCGEFVSCSYEVTDTTFDESFTAIAKGGYTFSHWRGGDGYLCAGSENPVCQVSNTSLAGNPNSEAVVAGASVFSIEPVFRVMRVPSSVVVDATGKFVGTPAGFYGGRWNVYTKVEGSTAAVRLYIEGGNRFQTEGTVYFTGYGCTGEAYTGNTLTNFLGGGLLRNASANITSVYAPNLSVDIVPAEQLTITAYTTSNGNCINNASVNNGDLYPAVAQELDATFPLKNVWR